MRIDKSELIKKIPRGKINLLIDIMKRPFKRLYRLLKWAFTLIKIRDFILISIGATAFIFFLGIPLWITVYLFDNYNYYFDVFHFQIFSCVEILWIAYWMYVVFTFVNEGVLKNECE
jgi:hypothetical protein